ncbi:recombination regulator RecX [Rossellomorea vietnamensis]|uniref:Regulatory protein RecX n=1 Tax=Rossellomorea vietnamensis TaxID=218284 RepID=A0A5D4MHQ4_9BACI|nr:recombination regulator RecX [Rossellomorea vietnamensis]TYS01097.1 recombination regulator RecX [Rossellomorea vietnamensis]
MGKITKITRQVKNQERYNIFIDGEYSFSVDEEIIARFQLGKGDEIDEVAMAEIGYEDDIRRAFNLAIHYLSFRMRTEKEVLDYLKKKELEQPVADEVIQKLKKYEYLNDQEFAKAFVNTQINTSDKGPGVVERELAAKGVDKASIEEAIETFTPDIQLEKAIILTDKLYKKYKKDSSMVAKQKTEQNLARKGYSFSVINLAWQETDNEKSEEEKLEAVLLHARKAHNRLHSKFTGYDYVNKMKQNLYRKGFSMEEIEGAIEILKEEE